MITLFRPKIRSRHATHTILRKKESWKNKLLSFKSVIRLGSFTQLPDTVSMGGNRIEINTVEAITNSANKLLMKECFTKNKVETADWFLFDKDKFLFNQMVLDGIAGYAKKAYSIEHLPYPIISKHINGSRGTGNKKHDSIQSLEQWMEGRNLSKYIFEKFYNYSREYRLHITEEGCFYTCRKMLKKDTPAKDKWYRNSDHCVWVVEENELFDKPVNWDSIVEHSIKALKAVGLDIGAVDVKVQSATNKNGKKRKSPSFIVIEINSAPSFGEITSEKYLEVLPELLKNKKEKTQNE